MKIRSGFVSNSSSSSFVVTDKEHPAWHFLLGVSVSDDTGFIIDGDEVHDIDDNGTWEAIWQFNALVGHDYDYTEFLTQTSFSG